MPVKSVAFRRGVRRVIPVLPGVVPFGLLAGVAAVEHGMTVWQACAASVVIFAGTAQVVAYELLPAGVLTALGAVVLINLRFLVLSASLAPYFAGLSLRRRLAAGYLLTTEVYATAVTGFDDHPDSDSHSRWASYLGSALPIWLTFQLATLAGALFGRSSDAGPVLQIAIPLAILALLVPAIRDRAGLAAAVVAAAVAVAAAGLDPSSRLFLASACGVAAGLVLPPRNDDGRVG